MDCLFVVKGSTPDMPVVSSSLVSPQSSKLPHAHQARRHKHKKNKEPRVAPSRRGESPARSPLPGLRSPASPNVGAPPGLTQPPPIQHAVVGTVVRHEARDFVEARGGQRARYPIAGGTYAVGACVIADLSDPPRQAAQVREVLGDANSLRTRIFAIAAENGTRFGFSKAALAEIASLQNATRPRGVDLTALPFVTIDNPTTRVMDQAVHIARDGDGYILRYAIADATYIIPEGSRISAEACERSASLYLPCDPPATLGEAIAMLEPSLGDMMGSLRPNEEHGAFVATVHLDAQGKVSRYDFARGTVESKAKLCFEEVQDYYDRAQRAHGSRGPLAHAAFTETLDLIKELGSKLATQADARGVLDLNNEGPSLGIKAGTDSELEVQDPHGNRQIDHWNAQVSILVNQLVGNTLAKANIQGLWRVQDAPDGKRLLQLRDALKKLGRPWKAGQSLQQYLAQQKRTNPKADPKTRLAKLLILQHSHAATFSTEATGHDALKLAHYSQFTAPMRRYPDVAVHHLLSALVEKRPVPYQNNAGHLERVVQNAEAFRAREKVVLHQVDALLTAAALKPLINASLQGVVVGLRPQGDTEIELITPPVKVHLPRKGAPQLRLGDTVNVTVRAADIDARTVNVQVESVRKKNRAA